MTSSKRYDLAREQMTELLRAERTPEPPWDVLERELFARIDRGASPRPRSVPVISPLVRGFGLAAAAAAIVMGLVTGGRLTGPGPFAVGPAHDRALAEVPRAAGDAGARGDLDLLALRPGDAVEAQGAEVSFVEAGSVRWTLLPGTRAIVRAVGAHGVGHVVALERGSLRAEVVPHDPAEGLVEAFAVEVAGTRVAVHGTLFTVTRAGDHVEVDVEHGAVAIGPAGYRGATTSRLLIGPSRGAFSLDGGRTARLLARPSDAPRVAARVVDAASAEPSHAAPLAPAPVRPRGSEPRSSPVLAEPAAPSVAPPSSGTVADALPPLRAEPAGGAPAADAKAHATYALLSPTSVRLLLTRCFAGVNMDRSPSVRRSISSTLRISVRRDGSIASLRFDPPLRPALQACAESFYAGRFAAGPQQIAVPLTIED